MELFKVIFIISLALLPIVKCMLFERQFADILLQIDGTREDRRLRINFYQAFEQKSMPDKERRYLSDDRLLQRIIIDENFDTDSQIVNDEGLITIKGRNNHNLEIHFLSLKPVPFFRFTQTLRVDQKGQYCFYLNIGQVNWYGGPEDRFQYWPIEKATYKNFSYITKEERNCAIAERYWLSSKGVAILPEDYIPLFIDQNTEKHENQLCFTAKLEPPYYYVSRNNEIDLSFDMIIAKNMRVAHMNALNTVGLPKHLPDEMMTRHPTWSTWALYKKEINDSVVRDFVSKITENGFHQGQVEIDDFWETCYGSLAFDKFKFPNVSALTEYIKKAGFRTTLWVHPFVNKDCEEWYTRAKVSGYLPGSTTWWNSKKDGAGHIDFSYSRSSKWFIEKLKNLKEETGIYGYKFDAGESSWVPQGPEYKNNFNPSQRTAEYVNSLFRLGIEFRTGFRTQSNGLYIRMIDKESDWTQNGGLPTLIPQLLTMNLAGYSFVLPDMIGGNGYNQPPDKELFVRWAQATAFMPAMQFSYPPWLYDQETVNLTKKLVDLHASWADYLIERFKLAVETGEPVNPPLWWLDTADVVARQIKDQFLLGDQVVVAPVVVQGQTERDIYLPIGTWKDGNTQKVHKGPKWLMNYPAPLVVLPYFYRD